MPGSTGPAGEPGEPGDQGETGPDGFAGLPGEDGKIVRYELVCQYHTSCSSFLCMGTSSYRGGWL